MKKPINTVIGIGIQNNSGGYFIKNDCVAQYVAVEGVDKNDAYLRFLGIVAPYSKFCSCCGRRWDDLEFDEWPAPEGGLTLGNFRQSEEGSNCVLHLIDGSKKICVYSNDD